jgi:hypothetical protein
VCREGDRRHDRRSDWAAATVAFALLDDVTTFVAVVLHLCGLAAAVALYELGSTRKDASTVEAELTGTVLQVTGGRVKRSRGDIASTRDAHTQEIGPETVLVLSGTGSAPLRVPTRIAADPALAPVLRESLLRGDVVLPDDARRIIHSL